MKFPHTCMYGNDPLKKFAEYPEAAGCFWMFRFTWNVILIRFHGKQYVSYILLSFSKISKDTSIIHNQYMEISS